MELEKAKIYEKVKNLEKFIIFEKQDIIYIEYKKEDNTNIYDKIEFSSKLTKLLHSDIIARVDDDYDIYITPKTTIKDLIDHYNNKSKQKIIDLKSFEKMIDLKVKNLIRILNMKNVNDEFQLFKEKTLIDVFKLNEKYKRKIFNKLYTMYKEEKNLEKEKNLTLERKGV